MTTLYTKKCRAVRRVASGTSSGGQTLRLALNRDWLIEEHRVNIQVSQGFAVAPASVDVRDFVAAIAIESSDGRRVFLTGAQAYDFGRLTETASPVTAVLGTTSTAAWAIDIHYAMDEMTHDMITALRSNELSTLDLVITFATDVVNVNGFKGGTTPAATTNGYSVQVESIEYEMLNDVVKSGERGTATKLGIMSHTSDKQEVQGTSTGSQPDFQLVVGNLTRFITLHVYNNSGAAPVLSDAILGNVRINLNGRDWRATDAKAIRADNGSTRGINYTGFYVLDFGDELTSMLDLTKVQQCKLQWDVVSGSPAWKVVLGQDYARVGN